MTGLVIRAACPCGWEDLIAFDAADPNAAADAALAHERETTHRANLSVPPEADAAEARNTLLDLCLAGLRAIEKVS